jgi:flagellar hook-length control protein FliK
MRVGYDAGGGTPFDATGAKAAGATAGDAASAGAGFFALLALLQAGAATGEVGAAATVDLADDGELGGGGAVGEEGEGAVAGDVIVSLSGASAAGSTAHLGAGSVAAETGTASATATQASLGGAAAGVVAHGAAQAVATVAGEAGTGEGALAGAAGEQPPSVASPAGAASASGASAVAAAPAAAAATATAPVPPARANAPEPDGAAAPAATGTAAIVGADEPSAVTRAAEGARSGEDTTARREGADDRSTTVRVVPGDVEASGDGAGAAGDSDERAFAGFGEGRGSVATSAASSAARIGLEPGSSAMQHAQADGAHATGAEHVALARDGAGPVETASRATGGAQRAPLGDGTSLPSWIERIASPQRLAAKRSTALRLDLEPAGLGRIEVRLSFGRDGVRAQVMTEHDHTRALLAQQQPQLAAALERSDLRLESFLVDVGFGDASGEAHREVEDPAAWDASFAAGAARESEPEVPAATIVTGLLSVRA